MLRPCHVSFESWSWTLRFRQELTMKRQRSRTTRANEHKMNTYGSPRTSYNIHVFMVILGSHRILTASQVCIPTINYPQVFPKSQGYFRTTSSATKAQVEPTYPNRSRTRADAPPSPVLVPRHLGKILVTLTLASQPPVPFACASTLVLYWSL